MTPDAKPIRIAIAGYGNLGRGVEQAVAQNDDLQLQGIYTRRDPHALRPRQLTTAVYGMDELDGYAAEIDVLILCGGSKDDLPVQSPQLAMRFNIVDSFDNHSRVPEHFAAVDEAARKGQTCAIISAGWDPGLFSLNRVLGEAVLPDGATYTFWGKGLSQGHSDAIRHVPGVAGGVQYTIPIDAAVEAARSGQQPELATRDKHRRECYVVLEDGADPQAVEQAIQTMPGYFADYDTTVHFISAEALSREHQAMPHGGFVIRSGSTSASAQQVVEFRLQLQSNPEFTASVLVAYARAAFRLHARGDHGAHTVLDIAPGLLSPKSAAELRQQYI